MRSEDLKQQQLEHLYRASRQPPAPNQDHLGSTSPSPLPTVGGVQDHKNGILSNMDPSRQTATRSVQEGEQSSHIGQMIPSEPGAFDVVVLENGRSSDSIEEEDRHPHPATLPEHHYPPPLEASLVNGTETEEQLRQQMKRQAEELERMEQELARLQPRKVATATKVAKEDEIIGNRLTDRERKAKKLLLGQKLSEASIASLATENAAACCMIQ